ncbi:superantigen-like protein [Staphylococcus agnetis]|uniref:exotoxin beta-grasp domain-containing protein n=1 Tax=Staphylococcus agnetis TaxID=985762 RepID=UPI00208F0D9B|nr:superantigen-like protein [Staphylococcus agnetis]MCO4349331.1 superantigen-like protein [Staphylococcus agnetis]
MKLSTIAKTSLALGILTTGVITTNAQSVDAVSTLNKSVQSKTYTSNELFDYYNKPYWDLRNVSGYKDGDKVEVVDSLQLTNVSLLGTDKSKFNDGNIPNIDVFVVKENGDRDTVNESIGGITQTNKENYSDYVTNPPITLTESNGNVTTSDYLGRHRIDKKEVSLKELDFKLRKHLIDNHGLYSKGKNKGDIIVKMKGDNPDHKYTLELDKKLQDHRMGDVIDATQIDRIDIEFK